MCDENTMFIGHVLQQEDIGARQEQKDREEARKKSVQEFSNCYDVLISADRQKRFNKNKPQKST
jgi:hypothetical protein